MTNSDQNNQTTTNSTEEKVNVNDMSREQLEQVIKTQQHSPEDVAAAFFALEMPRLRAAILTMSQKQLRRFLFNLVAYPLVPEGAEMKTDLEKSAYYLAEQMISNKTMMQLHAEMQRAENAQKLLEQQKLEKDNENSLEKS